jgi:N-acetylneuraminate synthase|tara:strand:+ start:11301 stop:12137 length:837 start_codon:yes stop_codon:yes gene_type:complete
MSVFVIAEIGINHNGSLDITRKLIDAAAAAGCDAVKFQKRTIEEVYTKEDLDRTRDSPWGTTNRQQKEGLEFGKEEYDIIDAYCKSAGIEWFASAWDLKSQKFLKQYDCKYNKVASALLTYRELLEDIASEKKHTFISTGMSTLEQIDKAVKIFEDAGCSYELMHCNSTYPMPIEDANLNVMHTLQKRYGRNVGYSGHESGIIISCAAVAIGASSLERHITLDRAMYGSDQSASLEITGLIRMLDYARDISKAMGSPEKRVMETEVSIAEKLRQYNTL